MAKSGVPRRVSRPNALGIWPFRASANVRRALRRCRGDRCRRVTRSRPCRAAREPAEAERGREPCERPEQLRLAGERDRAPAVGEARRVERGDERHLQRDVQADGDEHRDDDRERDVPPGSRLSPPSWTACSKPRHAKMTPPEASARKTPFHPDGMKPPAAVKFSPVRRGRSSATTVTTGTKIFQQTASLFVSREPAHAEDVDHAEEQSSAAATT